MHKNAKDITGNKYGKWTAIEQGERSGGRIKWWFKCECGKSKLLHSSNIVAGKSLSCGCDKGTHKNSYVPEWMVWYSMVNRCTNEKSQAWSFYGGRGVNVCESWLEYENFILDMGFRPTDKHQLDRVDNSNGYKKSNCRWVLSVDNVRNRRDSKYWFVNGVKYESMRHAAKSVGVAHSTIKNWCRDGVNGCYSERKYK